MLNNVIPGVGDPQGGRNAIARAKDLMVAGELTPTHVHLANPGLHVWLNRGLEEPLGRLVHGSTLQKLVRTARCPLLVLTRGPRAADTSDPPENRRKVVSTGTR